MPSTSPEADPDPETARVLALVDAATAEARTRDRQDLVSRLETPAFRPVRVPPERARMLLLLAVALAALLIARPWLTLVLLDLAYLAVLARAAWRARRPQPEA